MLPLGQRLVPQLPFQNFMFNPIPVLPLPDPSTAIAGTMFKGLQPLSTVVPNVVGTISNLVQPDGPTQPTSVLPLPNDAGRESVGQQSIPLPTAAPVPIPSQPSVAQATLQGTPQLTTPSLTNPAQAVVALANQQGAPIPTTTPIPIFSHSLLDQPVVPLPTPGQIPLIGRAFPMPAPAPIDNIPRNVLGLLSFATSDGPSDSEMKSEASGPVGQLHSVEVNLSPLVG